MHRLNLVWTSQCCKNSSIRRNERHYLHSSWHLDALCWKLAHVSRIPHTDSSPGTFIEQVILCNNCSSVKFNRQAVIHRRHTFVQMKAISWTLCRKPYVNWQMQYVRISKVHAVFYEQIAEGISCYHVPRKSITVIKNGTYLELIQSNLYSQSAYSRVWHTPAHLTFLHLITLSILYEEGSEEKTWT